MKGLASRKLVHAQALVCLLLTCATVQSQTESNKLLLSGELWAETEMNDNATRVPKGSGLPKVREQQHRAGAVLSGAYNSGATKFVSNYSAAQRYYTLESQEDDLAYNGQSSLDYGTKFSLIDLGLSHMTNRILNRADDENLNQNTNQQTIIGASAGLKSRADKVDSFKLIASYNRAEFKDSENRDDADQRSIEFMWLHRTVHGKNFGAALSVNDVSHKTAEQLDFEYYNRYVFLESTARNLDYSLKLGTSIAKSKTGVQPDKETPFFSALIQFNSYGNQFEGSTDYRLTSTSFVQGLDANADILTINGDNDVTDQVEAWTTLLSWTNTTLCGVCFVSADFQIQELDYTQFTESNQRSMVGSLSFRYDLTRDIELNSRYALRRTDFENNDARGFDVTTIEVGANYAFSRRGFAEIFIRDELRQPQDLEHEVLRYGFRVGFSYP